MIIDKVRLINGELRSIHIKNGTICAIKEAGCPLPKDEEYFDAGGLTAIPGMIDVHTHGIMGIDTLDCRLPELAMAYAKAGTTTVLPTASCASRETLLKLTSSRIDVEGANVPGFHLEGPYLSKDKAGAQNPRYIAEPNIDQFREYKNVKMMTVAPETDPDCDFIRQAAGEAIISIGHTTCSCDQAIKAIEAGASCLTHTFNAMPPMLHREPGPIGAAVEKQIYVQLICDGIHIARPIVQAAFRMFPGRVVLISDSLSPTGLPDGGYVCDGLAVTVKNGRASLKDKEGTLAGSTTTLLSCVKKAIEFGIPKKTAIDAATMIPAELLGLKKGIIAEGYDADILLTDGKLNLKNVIISGKFI